MSSAGPSPYAPLVIRKAQLRALGLATLEQFLERLSMHVSEVFPSHADFILSHSGQRFLRTCLKRAGQYGLKTEHSITLFTDMAVALGQDFDEQSRHAWIRNILDDSGLGPAGKIYMIYRALPQRCPEAPVPPPPGWADALDALPQLPPKVPRAKARWWGEAAP